MDYEQFIDKAQEIAVNFAPKILAALAIALIGMWMARIVANAVRRMMERIDVDPTLVRFLTNLTYIGLLVVVMLAAVAKLGVQTTSVIAILGAAGLAIGLALQKSLGNFAAGVLIVSFRPYRVGDFVEAAGISGTVSEVQMFTTVLKTVDNKRVIVPNGQIVDGVITNFSAHETRRVDLIIGASYDDDMLKVKEVLSSVVAETEGVLSEPAPQIFVNDLGNSSVNYALRAWVPTAEFIALRAVLTESVKRRFDEEGLHIPYPQVDNHVRMVEAA